MGGGSAEIALAIRRVPSPHNDVRMDGESAFWLGCVPTSNAAMVSEFVGLAKAARFEEMTRFACLEADDLVYGMLIQSSSDPCAYTVAVLRQHNEPLVDQPCLFAETVTGIKVIAKPSRRIELPESMRKLRLRDAFRAIFRRGRG